MNITIQPLGVLIGLAFTGLFSGLGLAFGNLIAKYYFEPKIIKWKKNGNKLHKRIVGGIKNGKF